MADNLRPCPFCGAPINGAKSLLGWHKADCFLVLLEEADITMTDEELMKALAESWNKRTDDNFDINALFAERDYYKSAAKHVYRVMQEAKELMQYIPRTCSTCYANDMDIREVDNPCWNCKGMGYPSWKWRNADHFREVTEMIDRGSYGSD